MGKSGGKPWEHRRKTRENLGKPWKTMGIGGKTHGKTIWEIKMRCWFFGRWENGNGKHMRRGFGGFEDGRMDDTVWTVWMKFLFVVWWKKTREMVLRMELEIIVDFQWLNTGCISFGGKWNWHEGEKLVWLCGLNAESYWRF